MSLTLTPLAEVPHVQSGDDLAAIILDALDATRITLHEGDILVLAQKIVSKSEGRMVDLATVRPSPRAIDLAKQAQKDPRVVELILAESADIVRTRPGLIVVEHKLGFICANAGIDHSNVQSEGAEQVLLLPENPSLSAEKLCQHIEADTGLKIGVLIIDSHGRAWRLGIVGVAIGFSRIPGVADLRGQPDMFGRILESTQVGVADELAAAASLMMGQAAEGTPVVHARGFPYPLRGGKLNELIRPKDEDLFR
ncbi:MAG: coenzyme F420-0:L-glutamate ligase [Chloroflexi bacterium]|nr:coenzyme F420-0:L-glutamate ligase [Chloroflexota bacterium]